MLFIELTHFAGGPRTLMILTCPACSTKYVVKDGAIPPVGRQVRCASCKHSWHQDAEASGEAVAAPPVQEQASVNPEEQVAAAWSQPHPAEATADHVDIGDAVDAPPPPTAPRPADDRQWAPVEPAAAWSEPVDEQRAAEKQLAEPEAEDFEPFYDHEPIDDQPRRKWPLLLLLVLLVALAAIAFWFVAPAEMKAKLGIASAGTSQLKVMLTNQNSQKLASGNTLFTVSGRIINSTDDRQPVPPIRAQLFDASKHLVYSWTISPPTPTLQPNTSASFNSAEVDVPEGGKHLSVRLGGPA